MNAKSVQGIDPRNMVAAFESRDLGALSDAAFYGQIVEIISKPPKQGLTSFTLHAPLELMARYGLLSHVDPLERGLSRLQMVASAAVYEDGVSPATTPDPISAIPDLATAQSELTQIFRAGDADGIEAMVLQISSQFGTASLANLLTPLALPTLTGASHSHIGLWLLLRHGRTAEVADAGLLRAAARNLAQDPQLQLTSFSGMNIAGSEPLSMTAKQIERDVLEKLVDPSKTKDASTGSLRFLLQAGERTATQTVCLLALFVTI